MLFCKTNKQALLLAIFIILLCLIGLVGATFALFTSDPNDGTIGIVTTAGYIKVDILNALDLTDSLKGKTLGMRSSTNETEVTFEPGATFFTNSFRIENEGTIPINYRIFISSDEEEDMAEIHRAFDIRISSNPEDPRDSVPLIDFQRSLDAGSISDESFYLIIRMKDTAGNEFQGRKYTGIGITVYAVQGNVDVKETGDSE